MNEYEWLRSAWEEGLINEDEDPQVYREKTSKFQIDRVGFIGGHRGQLSRPPLSEGAPRLKKKNETVGKLVRCWKKK